MFSSFKAASVALLALVACVAANDPADSWLSYAVYKDSANRMVTLVNTSWVVPSDPKTPFGSNAPGWWYGVQTNAGDGALIQPILAYGYQGAKYSIFNGVFDWTDGSWHTSPEVYTVSPGDLITSSVYYKGDRTYTMVISSGDKTISTDYTLLRGQTGNESAIYFVLEHQPETCRAYPTSGECTFKDINVAVDGTTITPTWAANQEDPKCNSKAVVVDSKTIKFTWDSSSSDDLRAAPQSATGARLAHAMKQLSRKWRPVA